MDSDALAPLLARDPRRINANAPTRGASHGLSGRRLGDLGTVAGNILHPAPSRSNPDPLVGLPPETRKVCAAVSLILKKAPHGLSPGSDGGEDEIRATSDLLTTRSPTREVAADALNGPQRGVPEGDKGGPYGKR